MTEQNQDFIFCPECGRRAVEYRGGRHWECAFCGFDLYNNVAAAVGLIVADGGGNVLFVKRAKEPRKGFLALPGGFADPGESAEEAACRECREEIGVSPRALRYLCSFPNVYWYKTVRYATCDLFFRAELGAAQRAGGGIMLGALLPDGSEVSGFALRRVTCAADIARIPLAFPSAEQALAEYLRSAKPNDQVS
jgi:ADP-ribose pyrophosphatase YjhB (NUDIX family)